MHAETCTRRSDARARTRVRDHMVVVKDRTCDGTDEVVERRRTRPVDMAY